ncbi:MAG: SBBP repeat-containing protein [Candidatus Bathyarchaeota archaeon]|nr:MAG: SBBP repeat-containing protein [Candidatus Bathyarchaeota archaeon]
MKRRALVIITIFALLGAVQTRSASSADESGEKEPISASTYLGGSGEEGFHPVTIAVGGDGCVFVAGKTESEDFPTTPGAYDGTFNGEQDIFVSKLDPDLTTLLASTFIGGSMIEFSCSLAVDDGGDVYIAAVTNSRDFPTTEAAYDVSYGGGDDFAVLRMDSDLTTLKASTFLGGRYRETAARRFMVLDGGSVYVTGLTESIDFPTTARAYDEAYNGGGDAFVARLDPDLRELLSSTFIGGSANDWAYSLALDREGGVYVTGHTDSANFPIVGDAHDGDYNGGTDVFVTRLYDDLSGITASTFLGGSAFDNTASIAVDELGRVYVSGHTASADFPTTLDAYSREYSGGSRDVFMTVFDAELSLLASTLLGGGERDIQPCIVLSDDEDVVISGATASSDFPASTGTGYGGSVDYFLSRMDAGLTSLVVSMYIGGSGEERFGDVTPGPGRDEFYASGSTGSGAFPVTVGAYDESYNGGDSDVFVMRISLAEGGEIERVEETWADGWQGIPGFPMPAILLGLMGVAVLLTLLRSGP